MSAIVLGTGIGSRRPAPVGPRAASPVRTVTRARTVRPVVELHPSAAAHASAHATAPRLRITRRGRAVLAALVALPLAIGGVVVGIGQQAAADQHGVSRGAYTYVTVQPGDTLWSIASDVAPKSDPRDVVDRIVDLNQLPTAELRAGERIAVPVSR